MLSVVFRVFVFVDHQCVTSKLIIYKSLHFNSFLKTWVTTSEGPEMLSAQNPILNHKYGHPILIGPSESGLL